jgi:hypothetical protein
MIVQRIIEILWLLVAIASVIVFFYLLFTEGFINGKAWIYIITAGVGSFMFYVRRRQRLMRDTRK